MLVVGVVADIAGKEDVAEDSLGVVAVDTAVAVDDRTAAVAEVLVDSQHVMSAPVVGKEGLVARDEVPSAACLV